MKSYQDSIEGLKAEIKQMTEQIALFERFKPESLYLMDENHIMMPRQYKTYDGSSWRNKIIFNVIASNEWGLPTTWGMTLEEIIIRKEKGTERLTPLNVKDLALYVHFKYKTPLFERIIKTGKLPRR